ncbi:hypothetical protein GQ473_07325 [archaeon]|nr:hypothetical protein [archaeon]
MVKEWVCRKSCNECCGNIAFPKAVFEKNRGKIQRPIFEELELDGEIYPATNDGVCVFNKADCRCAIYPDRPEVCRLYGTIPDLKCPYVDPRGVARTPAKVRRTQREINKRVTAQIKQIEKMRVD